MNDSLITLSATWSNGNAEGIEWLSCIIVDLCAISPVQVLDHECKGHLTREDLAKYHVEEGEPFSTEEIEEMMAAAVDPQKGVVYYRDYVQQLVEEQA